MAFKFDLKNRYYNKDNGIDYVVKKNRGYMIYGTLRASDQYTTGAAKVTNMTDTGVTFTYQE
ncbi:hypothetical protein NYE69_05270 [Paenibacillus sp. FSL R5-0527]|uniref:hypothetical protein n=1 Tax=Paenibacillus sp. FSL R5-0527 TaxID=2975321 RepID=UPI0030F535B6